MNRKYTYYIHALLALAGLVLSMPARADWSSFILNFDKNLYGKGGQTWQICPFDDKYTFMANKNGLVQFDGSSWQLHPLGNGSEARSVWVSATEERVYVGGINEFGYFSPDADGTLAYHCMSDTLPDEARMLGNVWGVHHSDNILYLQGDDRVIKWVGGNYTIIPLDAKIDCSEIVDGVLYAGTDRGVWMLVGNQFFPIQGNEVLERHRIRAFLPQPEGMLVVTAYGGLFYSDGHTVTPYVTGIEEVLRSGEVFCAAGQDKYIALGTIHYGLLLYDTESRGVRYFNENNGLHNNTVLSVAFDEMGNLWAGLDNGLDYINLNSPFTNLYTYPYSYGTGYAAALEGGRLFLGTNRGLYYTEYPVRQEGQRPRLVPVEGASGQVWNLCRVGDELFCTHDRGLFRISGTTLQRVTGLAGVWSCQAVMGHPDLMYVGVYSGIYLLRREGGSWQVVGKVEGMTDSCRRFEQENDSTLWVENTDHITRLVLNPARTAVTSMETFGEAEGFSRKDRVKICKIDSTVCFLTPNGCYLHAPYSDAAFKPVDELNRLLDGRFPLAAVVRNTEGLISLGANELSITPSAAFPGFKPSVYGIRQSQISLIPGYESIVPLPDGRIIIPYEEGFALFSPPTAWRRIDYEHALTIREMYLTFPGDSLVYRADFTRRKPLPAFDYKFNSVRFEYSLPHYLQNDEVVYRYRLNHGKWSDYTPLRVKEYSGLREGDYTFEVEALLPGGITSADEVAFHIRPPWYRSVYAYIVYGILLLVGIRMVYLWDDIRLRRKKQQVAAEKERQMKALEEQYEVERVERERQIMQLEKERLEHDLRHKTQEITNLMINFTRKNEVLAEIRTDILKACTLCKTESVRPLRQELLLINNKIDTNIQGDELLHRIEEEFDLLHNNLMKRLTEKHPDLSVNERMMCAYLKMNLSTKEIAPLLNLSVRGIESMRYRLRRKFGLEREDSIEEYLTQIAN